MTPRNVAQLFTEQIQAWPDLRKGVESLALAATREFEIRGVRVVALHIPHRAASTTASVDRQSILERPCFLCPQNRPPEQQGILFGDGLTVLANPFPILANHVTLVYREHLPQRIVAGAGRTGTADGALPGIHAMLAAARALPGFMVLYNGPGCGASAPDHLHFQACLHDGVPVVGDVGREVGGVLPDYLRTVFVVSGHEAPRVASRFDRLMSLLAEHAHRDDEPMVNVVCFHDAGEWTVLVFPRSKHRPEVYRQGRLTWSPGAIDMCGAVVLPVPGDLERITAEDIEQVFREVSMAPETALEIAARLGAK